MKFISNMSRKKIRKTNENLQIVVAAVLDGQNLVVELAVQAVVGHVVGHAVVRDVVHVDDDSCVDWVALSSLVVEVVQLQLLLVLNFDRKWRMDYVAHDVAFHRPFLSTVVDLHQAQPSN